MTDTCCGCGKHVSEWSDRVMPEPGQIWHPNCWVRIDWHVANENSGNPRPMTTAEKVAYVEKQGFRRGVEP